MARVELRRICKGYPGVTALDNVELVVEAGEFFTLLGPSGCGKTTLLRTIAGFNQQDSGEILFDGARIDTMPAHRRDIGMVYQDYAIFPHKSVADNVAFGLTTRRVPRPEIGERVARALDLVQLGGHAARMPHELSGGQQQRVALARAMVINPKILLMDEPLSSNLDAKLRVELRDETFPSALSPRDAEMPLVGARAPGSGDGPLVGMPSQRRAIVNPAAPFIRHVPPGTPIPLVLDSPHSGERYPDDFDHAPPRAEVRRAEDTHVARLYRSAPRHGATLIEAEFPRSYIDPNRSLADVDPELLADEWGAPLSPSRKTAQGIGLVWRVARSGVPMYGRKLTSAEVRTRIERCYRPYHEALEAELDARHRDFGAVWHLNCHSMPAVGDPNADDPGRARADFVLGDRDGTTCAPEFTHLVAAALREMGYDVAINDPYKGVEIVRRHGRPAERRHSLQIEVNRRLYMNEASLAPNAGFAALERDLDRLVAVLAAYVRHAARS